jgi:hypothetical protein
MSNDESEKNINSEFEEELELLKKTHEEKDREICKLKEEYEKIKIENKELFDENIQLNFKIESLKKKSENQNKIIDLEKKNKDLIDEIQNLKMEIHKQIHSQPEICVIKQYAPFLPETIEQSIQKNKDNNNVELDKNKITKTRTRNIRTIKSMLTSANLNNDHFNHSNSEVSSEYCYSRTNPQKINKNNQIVNFMRNIKTTKKIIASPLIQNRKI